MGYPVVEAGAHTLAGGARVVAGSATVNHEWKKIGFGGCMVEKKSCHDQPRAVSIEYAPALRRWNVLPAGCNREIWRFTEWLRH